MNAEAIHQACVEADDAARAAAASPQSRAALRAYHYALARYITTCADELYPEEDPDGQVD